MKKLINTTNAPAAIGPYSQAVAVGDLLFTSGQIPIDPATGEVVEGLEAQTRQVFANLKAVINAAGADLKDIVKTTVFLSDMNHFAAVNAIYAEYFTDCILPGRSAVQVARLPKDVMLEIEAIVDLSGK